MVGGAGKRVVSDVASPLAVSARSGLRPDVSGLRGAVHERWRVVVAVNARLEDQRHAAMVRWESQNGPPKNGGQDHPDPENIERGTE